MKENTLKLLKLDLHVRALAPYQSSSFLGNKLRGALGYSLAKLYCDLGEGEDGCSCLPPCVYGTVFKPVMSHPEFTSLPSPFSLSVSDFQGKSIKTGTRGVFSIILYGYAVNYWEEMVRAAIDMFSNANKAFNVYFELEAIESSLDHSVIWREGEFFHRPKYALWTDGVADLSASYDEEMELYVEFKTPFLDKEGEKKTLDFYELVDHVFYRIASMIDIYEGGSFTVPYSLLFRKPKVETLLHSKGVIYKGKFAKYLNYMSLGSELHIGKKCTYGYGEYRMEVLK